MSVSRRQVLYADISQVGRWKSEISRCLLAVNAGLSAWAANACGGDTDAAVLGPFRRRLGHAELFRAHLSSLFRSIA